MFSRTVSSENSSSRWNVRARPMRARLCEADAGDVLAVDERTGPTLGVSRPVITLNSVVLPAPFGPMSPVI